MAEFPALPLWTDAYLGDTTHLTTIEHGAYLLLLMTAWRTRDCRLPDDDRLLARYTRCGPNQWKKLRPILEPFFVVENGHWWQRRLTDEASAVRQRKESAAANGRASALKRKGRHSTEREQSVNENSAECQRESNLTNNHNQEEKEVTASGDAAPLAFEGRVIRLNELDFKRWERAYPDLDLGAVLQARDDWLADEADDKIRRKWFIATSNHLANLQQKARAAEKEAARGLEMPC